ncbi:MAG: glycoside hydrolase family 25 protein [Oscillospiraceae bacterium]|nr:glycoside hydrolase family 25 protein [Oscillospiraceae bacterium]
MNGIDVSQHNGVIDWEKVKASGQADFAVLRCGFGKEHPRQADSRFERNYAECTRLGIPVGAYHYSYALSPGDAEKEAEFCLKLIKGKRFQMPVWYDIEEKSQLDRGNCDDIAKAFCGRLEAEGYFVGVYTFDSFAKTNLSDKTKLRYAMWIARIGSEPRYSPFGMHQYSWAGKIGGISGNVDMNRCFLDYPKVIVGKKFNGN